MKKALIVATVGRFFDFEKNDIELLKELGYEVHCATNMNSDVNDSLEHFDVIKHQIDFARSPFSKDNLTAYKQLKILMSSMSFDLVHCHTPVGGILTRLVARKYRKGGTRVIYTAHGFHFFKGAPKLNWLIFYPLEKFFSRFTDTLITINKEDFNMATKKFHAKKVEYIPGVGVDTSAFCLEKYDSNKKRQELGLDDSDIIALSVGELSTRKNHEVALKAISQLSDADKKKIKYLIVGKGDLEEHLQQLCNELDLKNVIFLGYRKDVAELYACSDFYIFPSLQEGLPVALMEAMSTGLPVVCSNIRGNVDLIENGKGGYICDCYDVEGFKMAIEKILSNNCVDMGKINVETMKMFDLKNVQERMKIIYKNS